VIEFAPTSDDMRAAYTCPAGLGLQGRGKCNLVGGVERWKNGNQLKGLIVT